MLVRNGVHQQVRSLVLIVITIKPFVRRLLGSTRELTRNE